MSAQLAETKQGMETSLEFFKKELRSLRSGRANPSILDDVRVEVYGTKMRLKELATIAVAEARQLVITPFDPQTAGAIAKSIDAANLGLRAVVDGTLVRINIPPLTEEMRKEIVKQAKKRGEDAKVAIREARRKGNEAVKKLKSGGELTEDDFKRFEKEIQQWTDKFCKEIDGLLTTKEKEIMSV